MYLTVKNQLKNLSVREYTTLRTLCRLSKNLFNVDQEESYTSKASFFDDDELPTYNADNPQKYSFSGTRITRGQYRTSTGYILNADVNGALNILRKSKLVNLRVLQDRGCVLRPAANQPRRKFCYAQGYSGAVTSVSRR